MPKHLPKEKHSKSLNRRKGFGRYPEVFIGLALIAGGITFSLLFSSSTEKEGVDILVLSEAVQKDEVLKASQLVSVKVRAEDSLGLISSSQLDEVVGQKALINLPARTPILRLHFSSFSQIDEGYVLAGIRLRVGEYPSAHLRAGEFVDIVSASTDAAPLSQVEVYSVVLLGEGEGVDFFITLSIPEQMEQAFMKLIKGGDVRLFMNPVL